MSIVKVNSKVIGILFILPLLFYGIGSSLVEKVFLSEVVFLPSIEIQIGGLLMVLNSITVTVIGILLFPLLSVYRKGIALSYMITRIFEAIILLIGVISAFSIITLGQSLTVTELNTADFQHFRTLAFGMNAYAYQISMLLLGLGSIPFCYVMYKQQLIPAYFSLWGGIGYGLLFIGSICEFLGWSVGIMLAIPGGLFELSFGVWLLLKGFRIPS